MAGWARVAQTFDRVVEPDVPGAVAAQLGRLELDLAGKTVAITAGSRGLANLTALLAATVRFVQQAGGVPFLVPAMGSHGGGTAAGQLELLAGYGVTEETVGCEIKSSMEVVELPRGDLPMAVHLDAQASQADGIIVLNRVKPHTDFHGEHESGLMKMITIGLGNRAGAEAVHDRVNKRDGVEGLRDWMPRVALQKLKHAKILAGVAVVENAYDETQMVRAVRESEIPTIEKELLDMARASLPRLPLMDMDVLLVDEIGKNISGTGMDTNVIGRMYTHGTPEPVEPNVRIISCHSITPESHGNACGMGLADCVPKAFFDQVDFEATATNIITSNNLERGKLPVVCGSDAATWRTAVRAAGSGMDAVVAVRIRNTLQVAECWVSPAALELLRDKPGLTVLEEGLDLFTAEGELAPF